MKIGFDFDGVLTDSVFRTFIKSIRNNLLDKNEVVIVSTRIVADLVMKEILKEIGFDGIPIHIVESSFDFKSAYLKHKRIKIDLFFENDPYEMDEFQKNGVRCIWVPPTPGTLMEEIYINYIREKANLKEEK